MKAAKLFAIVFCLFLIGVSPKDSGQKLANILPAFSSGLESLHGSRLSAKPDSSTALPDGSTGQGEKIFIRYCTACHTDRLVWNSGMLAGEADSIVTLMSGKAGATLPPAGHKLLLEYLRSKLPRQ